MQKYDKQETHKQYKTSHMGRNVPKAGNVAE